MKKFLKGFAVFFFGMGIIVYTSMAFTEPDLAPVFIVMDVIFAFILFLILRKKKPKAPPAPVKVAPPKATHPSPKDEKRSSKYGITPADQFFLDNAAYLHEMEHQIIAPQIKDYGDVDSYRLAYEICLGHLHTLKDFCYKTPEGKQWFEDYYCHCFNIRCDDFSLEAQIEEGYQDLIDNWVVYERKFIAKRQATDFLLENGPYIRRKIIEIIRSEPGILQKDIYSKFDPSYREAIISIIGAMKREKVLFREPYKNTFRLYLSPPVLQNQSFNIQD